MRIGPRWGAAATWYVEGLATGMSVRAALRDASRGDVVVVCFSAHNMAYVVQTYGRGPSYVVADPGSRRRMRGAQRRRLPRRPADSQLVGAGQRGRQRPRPDPGRAG